MNPEDNDRGTTLLELLIALALMSMVMAGLFSVYWTGNKAFERQSSVSDAQYCARTAIQWITRDIMCSYPAEGDTGLDDDELTIRVMKDDEKKSASCHYFLSGTNLRRNNLAVAENITYLNFTRNSGSDLIKVTVEAGVNGQSCRLMSAAMPRVTSTGMQD